MSVRCKGSSTAGRSARSRTSAWSRATEGLGLGRALVRQALAGFRGAGVIRAYLEVTAENAGAVRLYREAGFRRAKTLYKAVDG